MASETVTESSSTVVVVVGVKVRSACYRPLIL